MERDECCRATHQRMSTPCLMTGKDGEEGPAREKQMGKEPKPAVLEAGGSIIILECERGTVKPPGDETGVGKRHTTVCPVEWAVGSQPLEENGVADYRAF